MNGCRAVGALPPFIVFIRYSKNGKEDPMLPLKKIICPTDFSEPSFEALEAAVELARYFSAELIVVHVVQPVPVVAAEYVSPAAFNISAYQAEMEMSSRMLLISRYRW
jgi:hypothetical protein